MQRGLNGKCAHVQRTSNSARFPPSGRRSKSIAECLAAQGMRAPAVGPSGGRSEKWHQRAVSADQSQRRRTVGRAVREVALTLRCWTSEHVRAAHHTSPCCQSPHPLWRRSLSLTPPSFQPSFSYLSDPFQFPLPYWDHRKPGPASRKVPSEALLPHDERRGYEECTECGTAVQAGREVCGNEAVEVAPRGTSRDSGGVRGVERVGAGARGLQQRVLRGSSQIDADVVAQLLL